MSKITSKLSFARFFFSLLFCDSGSHNRVVVKQNDFSALECNLSPKVNVLRNNLSVWHQSEVLSWQEECH